MNAIRIAAIGAAFAIIASPAAVAGHGKVGTWEVTTQMSGSGMPQMPNMANLPPEVQARMKAHGVMMHGAGGMTSRFCMTAEQVNSDKPPMTHHGDCQTQNVKIKGNTFSADIVCSGQMKGKGHTDMTFDSPEHYSGHQTMTMTVEGGQTMTHDLTMDAHWVSPTCAKGM
jgi:Protein of unknown function (DUF3617)